MRKYTTKQALTDALWVILKDIDKSAQAATSLVDINFLVQYCNFDYW